MMTLEKTMTQTKVISRVFIKCKDSTDVHVNDDIGENNDPDKGSHPDIHTDLSKQKVWR
jgi:hypothetical protein